MPMRHIPKSQPAFYRLFPQALCEIMRDVGPVLALRNGDDPRPDLTSDIVRVTAPISNWWSTFEYCALQIGRVVVFVEELSAGVRKELTFLMESDNIRAVIVDQRSNLEGTKYTTKGCVYLGREWRSHLTHAIHSLFERPIASTK